MTTRQFARIQPARAGWETTQTQQWWDTWLKAPERTFVEAVAMLYTVDITRVQELPGWYSLEAHAVIRHFVVGTPADGWLLVHLSERTIAEAFEDETPGIYTRAEVMKTVEDGTLVRPTLLELADLICAIHERVTNSRDQQKAAAAPNAREPKPLDDYQGLALLILRHWWDRERRAGLDAASARMFLAFCEAPLTSILGERVFDGATA